MFTQAEINALTAPLSNAARVLYCLGLRPSANKQTLMTAPLKYKPLLDLVNGDKSSEAYTRGREVNALLEELIQSGLVILPADLSTDESLNNKCIQLPLLGHQNDYQPLHQQHLAMHRDWQPEKSVFDDIATLIGLIDKSYDDTDIGEFVVYWIGRPEAVFSSYQWTQKFTYALKNRRTAKGYQATKKVGSQTVKVEPGLEADDNAKQLVAKYANKSGKK